MQKIDEIAVPTSCLNRARPNELLFVLLGRDPAAPVAIRAWVEERLRIGKNKSTDRKIQEALALADQIQALHFPAPDAPAVPGGHESDR